MGGWRRVMDRVGAGANAEFAARRLVMSPTWFGADAERIAMDACAVSIVSKLLQNSGAPD
jgi:hypothetical protein